jgi:hypothetical protein
MVLMSTDEKILLQERVDDFKKDIIKVCKEHRMSIHPDGDDYILWIDHSAPRYEDIENAHIGN